MEKLFIDCMPYMYSIWSVEYPIERTQETKDRYH